MYIFSLIYAVISGNTSITAWMDEFSQSNTQLSDRIDDRYHNVSQIVEENGFIFESHDVHTKDGYILGLHRVVDPNITTSDGSSKPAVLL